MAGSSEGKLGKDRSGEKKELAVLMPCAMSFFFFSSTCTHLDIKGVARLKSISGKDWREVIDWAQTGATNPGCTVPVGTLCCYRRTSLFLYSLAAFAGNTGSVCHGFSVKRNRLRASLRTNFFKSAPGKVQCNKESTSRSSF